MGNCRPRTQDVILLGILLMVSCSTFCRAQNETETTTEEISSSTFNLNIDNGEPTTESTTTTTTTEVPLTEEEQVALDQLREKITPDLPHNYMKTDDYLRRWLRAREWNVEQAEQMLRENLKWREENKIDTIGDEDWSDLQEDYPYTRDTRDKLGRPVGTISIGPWDIRAASYAGKMPRMHRYIAKLMEEATQGLYELQGMGINVTQWKVLLNLDGFGIRTHACTSCLSLYQTFASTYEDHYPGYADVFVLINTPTTFRVIIQLIKPFLSGKTQKQFKIYGRNEKVWKEYLDQEIAEDQRTVEFGGTKLEKTNKLSKFLRGMR